MWAPTIFLLPVLISLSFPLRNRLLFNFPSTHFSHSLKANQPTSQQSVFTISLTSTWQINRFRYLKGHEITNTSPNLDNNFQVLHSKFSLSEVLVQVHIPEEFQPVYNF